MSTTPTPIATQAPAKTKTESQKIGLYVELGGLGAFVAGAFLSVHHVAIGICFVAGAAAFVVGKKLQSS
jgi:hypothetical protein